jgi:hypothetical protein
MGCGLNNIPKSVFLQEINPLKTEGEIYLAPSKLHNTHCAPGLRIVSAELNVFT